MEGVDTVHRRTFMLWSAAIASLAGCTDDGADGGDGGTDGGDPNGTPVENPATIADPGYSGEAPNETNETNETNGTMRTQAAEG